MPDLDLLQGAWTVTSLELDGQRMPPDNLSEARIEIDGSRFTSTGMGAAYAGTFKLDAKARPRRIDLHFDAGPEAGNVNRGIYELKNGAWKLCLATNRGRRPTQFATTPGSGFALEILERAKAKAPKKPPQRAAAAPCAPSAGATELEGEWRMVSGVINGAAMDEAAVQWVKRVNRGNVSIVLAGPQTMLKVEFTLDAARAPHVIDYLNLAGRHKGKRQQGIYAIEGNVLKICVAAPGGARPGEFRSSPGDGRTFTIWTKV